MLKLGNTIYCCSDVTFKNEVEKCFIPSSVLAELRRDAIEHLQPIENKRLRTQEKPCANDTNMVWQPEYKRFPYMYNISNSLAKEFYKEQGMQAPEDAFEVKGNEKVPQSLLMQCKHCIKYSLGYCVKNGGIAPKWKEPLFLRLSDGRKFKLNFNCSQCQMDIYATD